MTPQLAGVDETESGDRYYHWDDGERYPSVTTVLDELPSKKEALEKWKKRTDNWREKRDRAALIGSAVHHRILNDIAIRPLEPPDIDLNLIDEDLVADIETAIALWNQLDIDPGDNPYVEEAIRSDEHRYAGRFDLLTERGDLIDIKTSKQSFLSHKIQISCYAKAAREMSELPNPDRAKIVVIHYGLDANPNMAAKVTTLRDPEIEEHFDTFLELLPKLHNS